MSYKAEKGGRGQSYLLGGLAIRRSRMPVNGDPGVRAHVGCSIPEEDLSLPDGLCRTGGAAEFQFCIAAQEIQALNDPVLIREVTPLRRDAETGVRNALIASGASSPG